MRLIEIFLVTVSFIQTVIGVLGNSFLLFLYIFTFFTGHKQRPMDSIFVNLALANLKLLLSKGVPYIIFFLGSKHFLNPLECKLVLYLHQVSRSISLSMTCLLSGFQVITISPNISRWSEFKAQPSKYIIISCLICWCFYLFINFIMFGTMHNIRFRSNKTRWWDLGYCSISGPTSFDVSSYAIVRSLPDVICVGFMIWSSTYLVYLLHRHHKQAQHIHSVRHSSRTFPEIRATHAILLLVCTFVFCYSIDSALSFYSFHFGKYYSFIMPITQIMAACFPILSPFVLMSYDSQVHRYFTTLCSKKSSC